MRKGSFATLGILALLAATSAFGQQKLQVAIPFEFHFADKVVSAGNYEVSMGSNGGGHLLSLECFACGAHVYSMTFPIGGGNAPAEARLVFNKYGDAYFLSEVWAPGISIGGGLSRSKTEREITRNTPDVTRVILVAQTGHVAVARR
jgi:hypothetical protein